jgi:type IV pilus assembly protein PilW
MSRGFSLVEVMVAMVIGMLGLIVMMQVFGLFEGQKRSTTGGSDAQNTGAIALFNLQRVLQQSGYGIGTLNTLGCSLTLPAAALDGTALSGITLSALAPVTINYPKITGLAGQDKNTDTLLVFYSNSNSTSEGNDITSQLAQNQYGVKVPGSFSQNDYVFAFPAARPSPCQLTLEQVNNVPTSNPVTTVNVPVGVAGVAGTPGAILFNLGQSVRILAYAIRSGNLTECDYMLNDCSKDDDKLWIPIASNIYSLKAEYGRDITAPLDAVVDTYDRTTPLTSSATLDCDWVRIYSVRLALVVRSTQFEKGVVTYTAKFNTTNNVSVPANEPTWLGDATNPIKGAGYIGPDNDQDNPWMHYRYKVFQTIVPLRNINWMITQGAAVKC